MDEKISLKELKKKAYEENDAQAQFELAGLYHEGGTRRGKRVEKNTGKFLELIISSAGHEHADAMCVLAILYEKGDGGLVRDRKKAVALYKKVAKKGQGQTRAHAKEFLTRDPIAHSIEAMKRHNREAGGGNNVAGKIYGDIKRRYG